jgi:predicted phage terminase large subunit-like protein
MLLMPPGSAKSTYASLLFPAWWLARHPTTSVITASHTARLAEHFGRGVRTLLSEHAPRLNIRLRHDSRAAGRFLTECGGEYFAIGVHGAVTGRRADLALIDDPIRSRMDAESPAARERLWNWYRTELVTRLKPNAKTVLVMTRWHTDDLAGRLIQQGGWKVLRLPALAESFDPLDREPGEALWPEWEDSQALLEKQATLGERGFAALFQQAPQADSGHLFDLSRIPFVDALPAGVAVRAWDLAGVGEGNGDPDWTAGVKLLRDEAGRYVVEDVCRVRKPSAEINTVVLDVANQDGESVLIALPKDPGQAGLYQISVLTAALAGFRVLSSPETGSKMLRAEGVASQIAVGNVRLKRGSWNTAFLEELSTFPRGKKDDQVDALSRAFAILAASQRSARYTLLPFLGR